MKKILSIILLSSTLLGCSLTQQLFYSPADEVFTDNFTQNVKNNSLDENIALLERIESDKEIMTIIINNKDEDSINHQYHFDYSFLKYHIKKTEKIINEQKEAMLIKIREKSFYDELYRLLNHCEKIPYNTISNDFKALSKRQTFKKISPDMQSKINQCLTLHEHKKDKEAEAEKIKKESLLQTQKEARIAEQKDKTEQLKKDAELKIIYDKAILVLDKKIFGVKIYCHEEDSYLIPESIDVFNKDIHRQTDNKAVLADLKAYYEPIIKECIDIYEKHSLAFEKSHPVKESDEDNRIETVYKKLFSSKDADEALQINSLIIRQIRKEDNLSLLDIVDYNNKKYFLLSNKTNKLQVYYPYDSKIDINKGDLLVEPLDYTLFDYGFIDGYETLILNNK